MNHLRLTDSIHSTLGALQSALAQQADELRRDIGCAAIARDQALEENLVEKAGLLDKVEDLVFQAAQVYAEIVQECSDTTTASGVDSSRDPAKERAPHHKAGRSRLDVEFQGKQYHDRDATDTFVEVIEAIGVERVYELHLPISRWDLVSKQKVPMKKGYPAQREIAGNWVITTFSTPSMKYTLERICSKLGLAIQSVVVPPDVPSLDIFDDCGVVE